MRIMVLIHSLVILGQMAASSQARLQADRTDVLIGDQLTITLTVPGVGASDWLNAGVEPFDTLENVDMISSGDLLELPGEGISKTWQVTVFDTGMVRIPRVQLRLVRNGQEVTEFTNDIPILVSGVVDSAGLAPIKPIVYEPVQFSDYLPYVLGAVGLTAIIAAIVYWRRRPKKEIVQSVIEDTRAAHEVALDNLHALEQKKLWQKGEVKAFHSELSHILRMYVEARFNVPALESTTSELRQRLRPVLSEEHFIEMMQMMSLEDLIKFAKAEPPMEVHSQHLEFVRAFVLSTKQVEETQETNA